ncbi:hypothetical protein CDAR_472951 [Caerostris darwini]|uniref:Uncharacterized protein n=1 Tax=Caerostris darwini TaxID=1538125 RepID=A0AAV4VAS8_9ARAC|nr:hypothetical protein CDAR_472951 [Caerostris darwini]
MHTRYIQDTHNSRAIHIRIFLSTRKRPLTRNGKKKSQQELKTELQYHFCARKRSGSILSKDHPPPLIARRGSSFRGCWYVGAASIFERVLLSDERFAVTIVPVMRPS